MTTLSAEALAELTRWLRDYEATHLGDSLKHVRLRRRRLDDAFFRHRAALLETARAYHRLTSAMAFLHDEPYLMLSPEQILADARKHGWKESPQ